MELTNQIQLLGRKIDKMIERNEKRFTILENKIDLILEKIDKMNEIVNNDVKENCEKMGEHIEFVEKVYKKVKRPMEYVTNSVNYMIKAKPEELPEIEGVSEREMIELH